MKKIIFIAIVMTNIFSKIFGQEDALKYPNAVDYVVSFDFIKSENNNPNDAKTRVESPLRMGLNYTLKTYKNKKVLLRLGARYLQFTNITKFPFSPNEFRQKIQIIEIPFDFRVYLGMKQVRPYLNFNLAINRGINQGSPSFLAVGAAFGIDYSMYDDIAVFLQPTFRKFIKNNENSATNLTSGSGIEFGLKYRYYR